MFTNMWLLDCLGKAMPGTMPDMVNADGDDLVFHRIVFPLAKGVIGKKRDNLGVQFKMAVHDHDWAHAVAAGEQIIAEFPNTRMAEEVRGMIDLLRERAAGQMAAQQG